MKTPSVVKPADILAIHNQHHKYCLFKKLWKSLRVQCVRPTSESPAETSHNDLDLCDTVSSWKCPFQAETLMLLENQRTFRGQLALPWLQRHPQQKQGCAVQQGPWETLSARHASFACVLALLF